MTYRHIKFDVSDEIATITLNRPEARNALSTEMREDMSTALEEIKDRAGGDVKAVILTGAGGAFCAGGDVKGMGNREMTPMDQRNRMRSGHNRIYDIVHLELPVISLVDGAAAGAGCNLALLGDFVLATPRAFFTQAFAKMPRLVGMQVAKELVFTGRRVHAEEAKELGLVHTIVGQDTAMEEARAFARRFCDASTAAIGMAKTILNESYNQDFRTLLEMEAMGQSLVRETEFHREAVRRFKEKDTPLFDWDRQT